MQPFTATLSSPQASVASESVGSLASETHRAHDFYILEKYFSAHSNQTQPKSFSISRGEIKKDIKSPFLTTISWQRPYRTERGKKLIQQSTHSLKSIPNKKMEGTFLQKSTPRKTANLLRIIMSHDFPREEGYKLISAPHILFATCFR